jgi:hypothetical protein
MKLQLDVFLTKIEFCLLVEKMATFVMNTDTLTVTAYLIIFVRRLGYNVLLISLWIENDIGIPNTWTYRRTEHISLTNFVRVYRINCIRKIRRVEAPLEGACFLMTNPVTHGNPSWTAHCRPGKVTTYWRRPSSDDPVPCTAFGFLGIFISTSLHCWVFAVGCVSCELVWTLS